MLVTAVIGFTLSILLVLVNDYRRSQLRSELLKACRSGDSNTVDMLIANGANVNSRDGWKTTPLMMASYGGHVDVIESLLDAGGSIMNGAALAGLP